MAELEDDADAAEILKGTIRLELRVNHGDTIRQHGFWLVMIEDDHVRASSLQFRDLGDHEVPQSTAIRSCGIFLPAAIDALRLSP